MTEPLTPPDCDLRGLPFMPLDGDRLMDSDLFLLSTGDEFKTALALWWASWKQVPAASLPDDDRLLAGLARLDPRRWARLRDVALRGWIRCSDGRLYHPVVAEKAREAWAARQKQRAKAKARWEKEKRGGGTPTACAAALPRDMQGTGTGTVEVHSDPNGSGAEAPSEGLFGPAPEPPRDLDAHAWNEAVGLLTGAGRMKPGPARAMFGKILRDTGLTARDLLPSIAAAAVAGTQDPQGYLTKAAAGVAKRRAQPAEVVDAGFC